MLGRKPEEIKMILSNPIVRSNYLFYAFKEENLLYLLVEALACSKCNPLLDYSSILQELKGNLPSCSNYDIYALLLYTQQREPNNPLYSDEIIAQLLRELNPDPLEDIEFINKALLSAIKIYNSFTDKTTAHWQTVCINLLENPSVNPSYPVINDKSVSDLFLKNFDYNLVLDNQLANIEWDTHGETVYMLKNIFLFGVKLQKIYDQFQIIPSLFEAMAENYFRQYQAAQSAEFKQENMGVITSNLNRLFNFAINDALHKNDFYLLNKFRYFQRRGLILNHSAALKTLIRSFKNWMTEPFKTRSRVPEIGYVERPLFQFLNAHFKPLVSDFIDEMAKYSLNVMEEYRCYFGHWYHAKDMLLVCRVHLSLKNHYFHDSHSLDNNPKLLLLMNQHALLILNTLADYIFAHVNEFKIVNEDRFFKWGTPIRFNNEDIYMPEHIAKLIEISRVASKEMSRANDLLCTYLRNIMDKVVPRENDGNKPKRRSQTIHDFYIALREEDLNHPIIKHLKMKVTQKILEPERQHIASGFNDLAPALQRKMDFDVIQLIYEYADVHEIKETKAPLKKLT